MMTKLNLDIELSLGLEQNKLYGTGLPLTMELAQLVRPVIEPKLSQWPGHWHYQDRVLCLLHVAFRSEIKEFYEGKGPCLCDLVSAFVQSKLDKLLLTKLMQIINFVEPELTQALQGSPTPNSSKPTTPQSSDIIEQIIKDFES
jgi:hypothetical protein